MGQGHSYLKKFTVKDENDRINYATSTMQGLRSYMEDAHTTILDLDHTGSTSFFGVYDGHGGANVALYCANRFHTELLRDEDYQNNLDGAVRHVFFRMDEQLREYDEWRALARPRRRRFSFNLLNCLRAITCAKVWFPPIVLLGHSTLAVITCHIPRIKGIPYSEGSTASVALIRGNQIIVGSVGDSRCVLSRNGQAIDLSTDHKPNLPDERRRIQNAGGRVTRDTRRVWCAGQERVQLGSYRVNGLLAMSRSIGDFILKSNGLSATEQMVTCNPDVRTVDITDDTEFLLIASDGIWDILSSQGAVDFVHQKLASGTTDLRTICEGLLSHCFRSRDNSTVILVQFKPAARIPLAPPASAAPVVNPSATETSSAANPEASAEAKADSGREIEELEGPLLPLSTLPSSSQLL
ncbi:probable protein phosphatase 2C 21 [Lolium rigidum]|uniref:probable protein phosphatase 2C 21 n=1 Tax=Lolium rigidum TaxID=89674 RepID=UPI001F5D28FB|nr:probable protein phosphatase 2C 21 [Lolium rigidum]